MSERMTAERLERIRQFIATDWLMRDGESALTYARELFRELDAVRAERDEYKREWESACERDRAANHLRKEAKRERDGEPLPEVEL